MSKYLQEYEIYKDMVLDTTKQKAMKITMSIVSSRTSFCQSWSYTGRQ